MVLSVNDKWHYCQNSDILVGSRAMRDRHLRLLGYCLVQVSAVCSRPLRGAEMGSVALQCGTGPSATCGGGSSELGVSPQGCRGAAVPSDF